MVTACDIIYDLMDNGKSLRIVKISTGILLKIKKKSEGISEGEDKVAGKQKKRKRARSGNVSRSINGWYGQTFYNIF